MEDDVTHVLAGRGLLQQRSVIQESTLVCISNGVGAPNDTFYVVTQNLIDPPAAR